MVVEAWISVSAESSSVARETRHRDAEVQDVYLCEWLFLAWTQCEPHPRPLAKGQGEQGN